MSRNPPGPDPVGASVRADRVLAGALVLIYGVCLLNAVIAIDFTRRQGGADPQLLERRYGKLRVRLDGVKRVSYISDRPSYFLGARYALVPTILDIGHVDFRREDRSIAGYHLDALVDDALLDPPLLVLCEFSSPESMDVFFSGLSTAATRRGVRVEVTLRAGSLRLLSVGG